MSSSPIPPTFPGAAAGRPEAAAEAAALLGRVEQVPLNPFHIRVAGILGVGIFFDSFDGLILAVALTAILQSLGAPLSVAGVLIAASYLGQIIGAIGFGFVSERYGRKIAFVVSSGIFGLLSLVAAFAWSVESLMLIRLLQGIGLGAEVPVAAAMFNEFVRAKARGRIVMIYESLFVWGILAASLVGGLMLAVFPPQNAWRYLFLIGGIPVLTSVWAYFRLPESPRHLLHKGDIDAARAVVESMEAQVRAGAPLDPVPPAPSAGTALTEPRTRFGELFGAEYRGRTAMLWCTWFTTYFALWGLTTFLPTLLVRAGLSQSAAALLSGAITIGDLIAVYIAAVTLDRLGRRFWFITGFALAIVGALLGVLGIGVLGISGWVVFFIAGATLLVGVNINAPLIYMYTAELYPTRMRAFATMVGSSLRSLAAVIAPITLGVLTTVPGGNVWMFALFGAVLAIGMAVFAKFGIETKQRALEELAR